MNEVVHIILNRWLFFQPNLGAFLLDLIAAGVTNKKFSKQISGDAKGAAGYGIQIKEQFSI